MFCENYVHGRISNMNVKELDLKIVHCATLFTRFLGTKGCTSGSGGDSKEQVNCGANE